MARDLRYHELGITSWFGKRKGDGMKRVRQLLMMTFLVLGSFTAAELARKCLDNGKHVFVEKPFTATVAQAEELIERADKKHLTLMVDHTFLFTGAVQKMKELIAQKVLGTLHYYDSVRVNLGLFQHDINVLWDLAPHDLSIMDYLIDTPPEAVIATGASHVNGLEDVA